MIDFAKLVDELEDAALDAGATWDRCTDEFQQKLESRVEAAKAALHAALSAQSTGSAGVEADPVAELAQIQAMLLSDQGDDDGSQILPDFDDGMSVAAMVSNCIHLLEQRRDALDAYKFKPDETGTQRSRLEAEGWSQASVVSCYWISAKPDHELVPVVNLDLRKLYEATHELAAAPTPPAGGGGTEAADAVAASVAASALRASEGLGLLKAAASACAARKATLAHAEPPASPAGDLNSLSAGAIRTLEGLERIRCSSHVSDEVVTAQDASKLIRALLNPAAPRKGPSEEEIAKLAPCSPEEIEAWEQWATGEGFDMHEHPLHYLFLETHTAAARKGWKAGLAFAASTIAPEDRGETQAVGDEDEARRQETVRSYQERLNRVKRGRSPDQNRGEPDRGGTNTEAGR